MKRWRLGGWENREGESGIEFKCCMLLCSYRVTCVVFPLPVSPTITTVLYFSRRYRIWFLHCKHTQTLHCLFMEAHAVANLEYGEPLPLLGDGQVHVRVEGET